MKNVISFNIKQVASKLIGKLGLILLVLGGVLGKINGVQALELNTKLLGNLKIGGVISTYSFYTDNKVLGDKKVRYDIGSAFLTVSKDAAPVGFTLQGGAYAFPVVGVGILKTPDATALFSPLPIAYLELAPSKEVSIQAGKLPTMIGYESAFTYLNNYTQRGLVWNMQPVINNGVRLSYNSPLSIFFKLGVNDGFYSLSSTHPKPAIEGSIGMAPTEGSTLYFSFILPDKGSKPNKTATPANKRLFNLVAAYTIGPVALAGDITYGEAPRSVDAGVPELARAIGGAVHISYSFKSFKISGRLEYVKDRQDAAGIDLVGLGDGNRAWTFTLTPAWIKEQFFVKGEFSYVNAKKPFTQDNKDNQARLGIELGFAF